MALYGQLQSFFEKDEGIVNIDVVSLKSVSDRMHSCIISALLRKEEGDDRDVTHTEITDKLFNKWENDQKAKIESLKKPTGPIMVNTVDFRGVDSGKTRVELATSNDVVKPLPSFLMLDENELVEADNQYPRKHRQGPPSPQLSKNRKWRGKHKKLTVT